MSNLSSFSGSVKSVQRGIIHQYIYAEKAPNHEITISSVNINKAILLITSVGPDQDSVSPRYDTLIASLKDATTILFTGFPPGSGGEVDYYLDISWQVIEFN